MLTGRLPPECHRLLDCGRMRGYRGSAHCWSGDGHRRERGFARIANRTAGAAYGPFMTYHGLHLMESTRPPLLEVRDLSMGFLNPKTGEQRSVLQGLDLEVNPGEVVSLVGPSGAGKTTLLRLIAGLEQPTAGSIRWPGAGAGDPPVAMLFQDYGRSLFPWLSVERQLLLALAARDLEYAVKQTRVTEALRITGLAEYRHHLPKQLSGGMQQRVAFARALLQEPQLLLLDEPFGSLDSFTRMRLEDYVLDVAAQLRLAILLVTHDVDEAVYMADRAITIAGTPAVMTATVPVRFPRPRNFALRLTPEFAALKAVVVEAVHATS
jgi:NitT/TauT family transport system ATP-binding protein